MRQPHATAFKPSCIPFNRTTAFHTGNHEQHAMCLVLQALNAPHQDQLPAEPSSVTGPLHASAPGAQAPPSPLQPPAAAAAAGPAAGPAQHSRPMNGPLTSALARHHRRTTSNGGSSDGAGSPNLFPAQAPVTPAGAAAAGTLSPQSTAASTAAAAAASASDIAAGVQQLTVGRAHSQVCCCCMPGNRKRVVCQ